MKKLRLRVWAAGLVPAVAAVTLIGAGIAYAFNSGGNPGGLGVNTITWTGNGATNGALNPDGIKCGEADNPFGANQPYLHWIFTTDGGSTAEDPAPVLNVEGTDYPEGPPFEAKVHHFYTPYFTPDTDTLTAIATFTVIDAGEGAWILTISHGCPGSVTDPASLQILKFYDANANGIHDGGELEITGWQVSYNLIPGLTPVLVDPIAPGDYTVAEGTPVETNWLHTTPTSVSVTIEDGENEIVKFGNVCLGAGGGMTLGFWSNKNGQALVGADDLAMLVALNLRNANGSHFDPASKLALKNWLLAGTAVNMANMLSVQLAAMELNVFNGKVSGDALVYGGPTLGFLTINALMTLANTDLGLHGNTTASGPERSYQEALKNALDAANNNLNFVQATACPFSFAA